MICYPISTQSTKKDCIFDRLTVYMDGTPYPIMRLWIKKQNSNVKKIEYSKL